MALEKPRIKLPERIETGKVIEIKTYVSHVMETGQRKDPKSGQLVPRLILNSFVARFNGQEVFRAKLQPGIAANPYLAFHMLVTGAGELELTWTEDGGEALVEKVKVEVA